ncbi:hypothetical protein C8Q80DRAFT_514040 [Daedaleopsis nitida]|nr:hypothetical protein C8Q80DRAFT_514040 [Daedaleopsis nitida]
MEPPILSNAEGTVAEEQEEHRRELRNTLACAARSCRALSEPALAVLWKTIDDVTHLLSVFPHFRPCLSGSIIFMFHHDITDSAWRRFQTYAPIVKVLQQSISRWERISKSVWIALARRCGLSPLLPNLEVLSTIPLGYESPYITIFLTPTLRRLTLNYGELNYAEDHYSTRALFRSITKTSPDVTHLTLLNGVEEDADYPGRTKDVAVAYELQPLKRYDGLQSLDVGDSILDLDMLQWLADLPDLHTLKGTIAMGCRDVGEDDLSSDDEGRFDEGSFQHLKTLALRGKPHELGVFLRETGVSILETLTLNILDPVPPALLCRHLTSCIRSIVDHKNLPIQDFTLKYCHEDEYEGRIMYSVMDFARPVLTMHVLKRVSFLFYKLPSLTDEDLAQMIDAWPNLTALSLPGTKLYYPKRARPTASCLVAFAQRCPHLRTLTLPEIETRTLPEISDMPYVNHPLHRLQVWWDMSRSTDLRKLAIFVDRLFPCVIFHEYSKEASTSLLNPDRPLPKEDKLSDCLRAMQEGRRHCGLLKLLPRARAAPIAGCVSPTVW